MSMLRHLRLPLLQICRQQVAFMSTGTSKLVDVVINEQTGIATVTMQRAPVNSLSMDLLKQLINTFEQLEENRKCRGMIITSSLPTVFCAGLDILEFYKPNLERQHEFWKTFQEFWLVLYGMTLPTAAAINGHAPAGGCVVALSCDYRVMVGSKFKIGLNETQLGIVAPKWVRETMLRVLPQRQSELALMNGTLFNPDDALKLGLIDDIASDKQDALTKANNFIQSQAKTSSAARKLTKMSLRLDIIDWLNQNREADSAEFLDHVNLPETQGIIGQYLESLKKK